jgi:hypothetical protein
MTECYTKVYNDDSCNEKKFKSRISMGLASMKNLHFWNPRLVQHGIKLCVEFSIPAKIRRKINAYHSIKSNQITSALNLHHITLSSQRHIARAHLEMIHPFRSKTMLVLCKSYFSFPDEEDFTLSITFIKT